MSDAAEGPGAALKDARIALDVTTREVADALNLPVSVVEAMEANDYELLPQPVFTRGYLRSYARLLELDPAAIVARYPVVSEGGLETGEQELVTPAQTKALPLEKKVLAGLGGLVLALLLFLWLLPGDESPEEPVQAAVDATAAEPGAAEAAATEPETVEAVSEAAPVTATAGTEALPEEPATAAPESRPPAAAERVPTSPTSVAPQRAIEQVNASPIELEATSGEELAAAAPAAEAAARPEPTTATAPEPDAAAASAPLEAPTPAGFRRITPFGDDELVLTFAEDCWVQVRDLDGVNLYGDLNRAGGTLRLIGRAPFRVRLGYAPGATLELNGDAVALTRYTRNNVANLVVGR